MINKPNGYDDSPAFTGEYELLTLGGKVLQILKAEAIKTKGGKDAIMVLFDIAEGNNKGYYTRQWNLDSNKTNRKWRGSMLQMVGDDVDESGKKSMQFFKGFITSLEESNQGYKWDWDETSLKGKFIGGVFGREQYIKQDGTLGFATKCVSVRSVQAVRKGIEPPADKLLSEDKLNGNQYSMSTPSTANGDFAPLPSDDDLPF